MMTAHDQTPDAAGEHTGQAAAAPEVNAPAGQDATYIRTASWPPFIPRAEQPRPPRLSRALIAAGIGVSLGAIALIAYGFSIRVPHGGRAAETLAPVTEFFVWFLVLGSLTALTVLAIGVGALLGRNVSYSAATLLAATLAMSAWTYTSSVPASIGVRVSGFGARPAPELAQLAWPLLTVAAALILVGSMWAINTRQTLRRSVPAVLSPWTAAGVALSLLAGVAVADWWWPRTQTRVQTAERAALAPLPTSLGSDVAYSLPLYEPENLLPAGPGFVIFHPGGSLTGFDGPNGAVRWKATAQVFPDDCLLDTVRSTGISADAVVIAQCRRPRLHSVTATGGRGEPVLMGFDANTGQQLWLNDDGFELPSGSGRSDAIAAVVRREEQVGALDPRTGTVRWTRPLTEDQWAGWADVINDDIVLTPDYGDATVRVLNGDTGAERLIDLPVQHPSLATIPFAADAGLLIVQTRIQERAVNPADRPRDTYGTWKIDIATGAVEPIPSIYGANPDFPMPGPLVQLGSESRRDQPRYVEVYSLPQRRLIRVPDVSTSTGLVARYAWAQIGENLVTAADRATDAADLVTVAPDGTVTRTPSPCPVDRVGERGGGILPVPGATLVLCRLTQDISGWDVLGLR